MRLAQPELSSRGKEVGKMGIGKERSNLIAKGKTEYLWERQLWQPERFVQERLQEVEVSGT